MKHDELTYPPMDDTIGQDAWAQMGPCVTESGIEYYGVRGIDGERYVLTGSGDVWRVFRAGDYGPGAVTSSSTPKGAVQRLNVFHEGETCVNCGHVNSYRVHHCLKCGKRVYVDVETGEYVNPRVRYAETHVQTATKENA